MPQPSADPIPQKTVLHARHLAHGAKMVNFAGWEMPVEYSGLSAEHMAVRTRAGIFDVSHMGEIEMAGADVPTALQRVTTNDVSRLRVGQAQYTILATPEGTVLDDLIVSRLGEDHFLLVVNAASASRDFRWIADHVRDYDDAAVVNVSARYGLIALQGPASNEVLQQLTGVDLGELKTYWFTTGEVANIRVTISRTGYTGEDGFEIFVPPQSAVRVWDALLEAGRETDVIPVGLGARDALRLEAGMRLVGQDMDNTTTLLEAALDRVIAWDKGEFIGREALERQRAVGVERRLVGFEMVDRGIARHGHDVYQDDAKVGYVTSGTQTPYLRKAIGMAYVPSACSRPGTNVTVDVRGRRAAARIVALPFYKRARG